MFGFGVQDATVTEVGWGEGGLSSVGDKGEGGQRQRRGGGGRRRRRRRRNGPSIDFLQCYVCREDGGR